MAGKVTFIIDAQDRGAVQAFTKLSDAERKQLLELMRLQTKSNELEASLKKAGQAGEVAARRMTQGYNEVERAATRAAIAAAKVEQASMRRTNLRHEGNLGVSQQTRAILRQGGDSMYVQRMQEEFGPIMAQRQQVAAQLRARRAADQKRQNEAATMAASIQMSQTVASAMQDIRARRSADIDARLQADAPGMLGQTAINFARSGGTFDGDDRFMQKARRRIARDLQRFPELAGKVTEEEFEAMSRRLGDKMAQTRGRLRRGLQLVGGALTGFSAVLMGAGGTVLADASAREKDAAERTQTKSFRMTRDQLKQQSGGDQAVFNKDLALADSLRTKYGQDAERAYALAFDFRSNKMSDQDITEVMESERLGVNPQDLISFMFKMRTNYPTQNMTAARALDLLAKSSAPSAANFTDLAKTSGTAASSWSSIGGTPEDQMAVAAILTNALKSTDQASEEQKSFANAISKRRGDIALKPGEKLPANPIEWLNALPNFEKEGRLTSDSGTRQTVEEWLGEVNAKDVFRLYQSNKAEIDALTKQNRNFKEGQTSGRLINKMKDIKDPVADTAAAAVAAKERLKAAAEETTAIPSNILDRVSADQEAQRVKAGERVMASASKYAWGLSRAWYGDTEAAYGQLFKPDSGMTVDEKRLLIQRRLPTAPDELKAMLGSTTRGVLSTYNRESEISPELRTIRDELIRAQLEKYEAEGATVQQIDPEAEAQKIYKRGFKIGNKGRIQTIGGKQIESMYRGYLSRGFTNLSAEEAQRAIAEDYKTGGKWSQSPEGLQYLKEYGTLGGDQRYAAKERFNKSMQTADIGGIVRAAGDYFGSEGGILGSAKSVAASIVGPGSEAAQVARLQTLQQTAAEKTIGAMDAMVAVFNRMNDPKPGTSPKYPRGTLSDTQGKP